MLKNAVSKKEISIIVENKVGGLAEIAQLISDKGINIEAIAGYVKENGKEAEVMIVTDNSTASLEALKTKGFKGIKERDVIIVELENRPGALKEISLKLAQKGIDMKHIYGTATPGDAPAKLVISSNDNQKTFSALKG